jgi:hypothetical protein
LRGARISPPEIFELARRNLGFAENLRHDVWIPASVMEPQNVYIAVVRVEVVVKKESPLAVAG